MASRPAERQALESASPARKGTRAGPPAGGAEPRAAAGDRQAVSPLERVLLALVYAGLFVYLIYPYSDFDWGWHYRYGEYFFTHGRVLRHDPFSWTMPGYEWVNHSWLYDLVLYVLYTRTGFIGLSVAGALAGLLTFHLAIRRARLAYWQVAIVAVFFAELTKDIMLQGIRTQVVGLLLLAVLGELLIRQREGQNWVYWVLPGLFCLWANLHGSFLLGLVITGTFLGWDLVVAQIEGVPLPRRWFLFAGSLLVSVVATLVNPFTYGIYLEARKHFANPHLTYVVEWMPPNFSELVGMLFLTYTLVVAFGFVSRRKLADVPYLVVAVATFYMAATARRHVAVFVVLTLPIIAAVVKELRFKARSVARTSVLAAATVALVVLVGYVKRDEVRDFTRSSMYTYCAYGPNCSEPLTQKLLREPPVGRGFNFYDWGGFLIGRGVKTQLFIDGRMHLWERSDYQPMADYRAIYVDNDMAAFKRHNFDWFLVPRTSPFLKDLIADEKLPPGEVGSRIWIVAYQDDKALYAVRKKPN